MHEEDSKGTQEPHDRQGLHPVWLGEMSHAYRSYQQFHEMRHDAARAHHDHRLVANVVSLDNLRSSNREWSTEFSIRIAGVELTFERFVRCHRRLYKYGQAMDVHGADRYAMAVVCIRNRVRMRDREKDMFFSIE